MPKSATCNACGSDVLFDAYADVNGEVISWFSDWVCSNCDASGKSESSGEGYTIKETDDAVS